MGVRFSWSILADDPAFELGDRSVFARQVRLCERAIGGREFDHADVEALIDGLPQASVAIGGALTMPAVSRAVTA